MEYKFSDRISALQPSIIREILKGTGGTDIIPFAAGNPAAESFPVNEMSQIAAELFASSPAAALQYGITEGYPVLREQTRIRMQEKYSVGNDDIDDTLIVSGGQQGIELAAKVLCNEGDTVICESPSFIGALNAFRSYNLNLKGVDLENDGMDLDKLEAILKNDSKVKLLYVISTFQNPSGVTTSLEKRKALLELADKYDFIIIEDSPYFELRYSGDYVPPIKALDKNGRVIFAGSYSKVLAPGIRMGFATAPKPIASKMTVAKQVSDVHTNQFFQMLVSEFLKKHSIDAHIDSIKNLYRVKRDRMMDAVKAYFPEEITVNRPDGGLFLWCMMPKGYDSAAFCKTLAPYKVAAVPGAAFVIDQSEISSGIRLNFSLPTLEQIDRGIASLAEAAKCFIRK
ncbi:MAG: PLP-dependent aminotransferase family protein [Clostridia bacterium]|nr:PLP-dependent aminotransferase family protein [Clostridia bacterium]